MFRDVYNVTITDQWPAEGFELDVEFPIVIDGDIVNISKHNNNIIIILFTNVINTVHNSEFVVATNVISGGINTLQLYQMNYYYLLNNKLRSTLSNSYEEENTKSLELHVILKWNIVYHLIYNKNKVLVLNKLEE